MRATLNDRVARTRLTDDCATTGLADVHWPRMLRPALSPAPLTTLLRSLPAEEWRRPMRNCELSGCVWTIIIGLRLTRRRKVPRTVSVPGPIMIGSTAGGDWESASDTPTSRSISPMAPPAIPVAFVR